MASTEIQKILKDSYRAYATVKSLYEEKKSCYNCRYRVFKSFEFPCRECTKKSKWEKYK